MRLRNSHAPNIHEANNRTKKELIMARLIACLMLIFVFSVNSQATPLHWTVLDIPVLIVNEGGSTGSGVVLHRKDGGYLVTAKHVFYNMSSNKLLSKNASVLSYEGVDRQRDVSSTNLNLEVLEKNGSIKTHPTHDVAVIQLLENKVLDGEKAISFSKGVTFKTQIPSFRAVSENRLRKFNDIAISQDIFIFGYPIAIGTGSQQFEPAVPLIRKCIISGKNSVRKTLITDCPVYHGNSGGPVIATFEGPAGVSYDMIGVVTQYIPFKMDKFKTKVKSDESTNSELFGNSGYSVVEPIDFVLELMPGEL